MLLNLTSSKSQPYSQNQITPFEMPWHYFVTQNGWNYLYDGKVRTAATQNSLQEEKAKKSSWNRFKISKAQSV